MTNLDDYNEQHEQGSAFESFMKKLFEDEDALHTDQLPHEDHEDKEMFDMITAEIQELADILGLDHHNSKKSLVERALRCSTCPVNKDCQVSDDIKKEVFLMVAKLGNDTIFNDDFTIMGALKEESTPMDDFSVVFVTALLATQAKTQKYAHLLTDELVGPLMGLITLIFSQGFELGRLFEIDPDVLKGYVNLDDEEE